ncbi:MAG: hypothetical protein Q4B04_04685 [bacterium]|nr:hypothetical protein [bacterium]
MTEAEQNQLKQMQQQAIERVREMEKRARPNPNASFEIPPMPDFVRTPYPRNENSSAEQTPTAPVQPQTPPKPADKKSGFNLLNLLNFKNIKMDNDITVIIVLLFLLSSEGGDELLLLALLYIML